MRLSRCPRSGNSPHCSARSGDDAPVRWRASAVALVVFVAGCGGGGGHTINVGAPDAPDRIMLPSTAFDDGAAIPRRFTCDGGNTPPPLLWTNPPARTLSLAL